MKTVALKSICANTVKKQDQVDDVRIDVFKMR